MSIGGRFVNSKHSKNARPLHKYLWRLIKHKVAIIPHGLRLGVPILSLLAHDWDKFLPWMISAYTTAYANGLGETPKAEIGAKFPEFDRAWRAHVARNRHHWEWFRGGSFQQNMNGFTHTINFPTIEMPDADRREMLADWRAMNSTPEGLRLWYQENSSKIVLHPLTRMWLEAKLYEGVPYPTVKRTASS